jgi:glucose/arabinose dehydrogenase
MKSLIGYVLCTIVVVYSSQVTELRAEVPLNGLTPAEKLTGWTMLFDGKSTTGWRNFKKDGIGDGWQVQDGALSRVASGAGDIITVEQYEYFELSLDYKISKGGNSGVMYHVSESLARPWHTGPEIQVQDNADGHDPQKAGWLYQLYKPSKPNWAKMFEAQVGYQGIEMDDATRPAGQWNQLYLRIAKKDCEVQLNGVSYFHFNMNSKDWTERIAKSKFAKYPEFGKTGKGHICLQDHGNMVSYRNIKIRLPRAGGAAPKSSDSKMHLEVVEAFPQIKWEDFEGADENGRVQVLRPVELIHPGDGTNRLFAADQRGRIYAINNQADVKEATVILDIQDRVQAHDAASNVNEEGLLGMAIHPNFKQNGYVFVYYTSNKSSLKNGRFSYVSRFTVDQTTGTASGDSELILMKIDQPFANHNGGPMTFGNDGLLYIGFGDGGGRNDPDGRGQDLSNLMGTILRIDVDHKSEGKNYSIPKDNPFLGTKGALPEIYAYGIRNPWRIANDPLTGNIWIADVGQDQWEEINILRKGANYGWSIAEGSYGFGNAKVDPNVKVTDPVWEYDHQIGKSVTGGYVYRGKVFPKLVGCYLFADYTSGRIWALRYDSKTQRVTENIQLRGTGSPVMAFGLDEQGEVYFTGESVNGKSIFKFRPN